MVVCAHIFNNYLKKKIQNLFILIKKKDIKYMHIHINVVCFFFKYKKSFSCTPQSFCPQPRCRVASHVPGPRQHYLRMLQNRIPACKGQTKQHAL